MSTTHLAILSSGGLRSLVATALALQGPEKRRVTLIHIVDGRDHGMSRMAHVRQQAEMYGITRVTELDLPHLFGDGQGAADGQPAGTLAAPQRLLAGLTHARRIQAQRLLWPAAVNGDIRAIGKATEQMVLCGHLADLEPGPPLPAIEAPLLEYTDQQIIELGGQLAVNWTLARSCQADGETSCRTCPACRRRASAFDEAGILDPATTAADLPRRRPRPAPTA